MLKSYEELSKVDVLPFCDERDGMKYLPWAVCKKLLHENGAEKVYFTPLQGIDGSSLIKSDIVFADSKGNTNRCYETRIKVVIDDLEFEMQSPVMNGANPVKDNSMSQQRLWNSMTRSFVKGVAIHTGLGFSLWAAEENEIVKAISKDVYHDINMIRERVFEKVTKLNKSGLSLTGIGEKMNKTEDEIKNYLSQYKILCSFESNLDYLIKNL